MANSAGSVHARLPAALDKILRDRGLSAPDGGPLYAYRFTADEIAALKEPLTQVLAWAGTAVSTRHGALGHLSLSPAIGLAAGEARESGVMPRSAPELGLQYHQEHWHYVTSRSAKACAAGAVACVGSENGSDEYLASLICEGGLPLRAIQGGRWLYQWLQGALDLVARGVDPRSGRGAGSLACPPSQERLDRLWRRNLSSRCIDQARLGANSTDRAGLDPSLGST